MNVSVKIERVPFVKGWLVLPQALDDAPVLRLQKPGFFHEGAEPLGDQHIPPVPHNVDQFRVGIDRLRSRTDCPWIVDEGLLSPTIIFPSRAASRSMMKSAAARSTSGERSRPWFQRLDFRFSQSSASGKFTSDLAAAAA